MPCRKERPPFGVVFVNPHEKARRESNPDPAYVGVQQAIATAMDHLRPGLARPILIALIGLRMGLGGDREDRLRSACAQIRAAYDTLENYPDVDIAFVLDDVAKYEIFLEARRREKAERGIAELSFDAEQLGPLVEAMKNEECVLFVGAGLSQNAQMPSYKMLIETLARDIGVTEELSSEVDTYLDIAQAYRNQGKSVQSVVAELFGSGADHILPSLAHYLLMSLPIRIVITTNYDHLLEKTQEALRNYPLRIVDHEAISQTGYRDGNYIVKFHGDAEDGDVVLSRDDYDRFFTKRPEMASLLEGLLLNQTFFFVGYSLRDPNFRQIYSKIDHMLRTAKRPAFATTFDLVKGYVKDQYTRKQLRLIELGKPSDTSTTHPPEWERWQATRRFLAFLDRLSEEVSEGTHLLLARETMQAKQTTLTPLAEALAVAGDRLLEVIKEPLSVEETRLVARTLKFLCEQGWCPAENLRLSVTRLWCRLADNLPPGETTIREKRQYLMTALRYAIDSRMAHQIRQTLVSPPNKTSS